MRCWAHSCSPMQTRLSIPSAICYETYICTTFVGCPTQSHACCPALYYVCLLLFVHIVHVHLWCLGYVYVRVQLCMYCAVCTCTWMYGVFILIRVLHLIVAVRKICIYIYTVWLTPSCTSSVWITLLIVKNVLSKCRALSTGHPDHLIRPDGWGNIYNHAVGMTPSCTSGVCRVV